MRAAVLAVCLAFAVAGPAAAVAEPAEVAIQFAAFGPDRIDILPGERVTWRNVSERRHTVTADDGTFASGELLGGDVFTHAFDRVGAYAYHCTIHRSMTGELDVRRITLGPLPTAAVPTGKRVAFDGRTADPGLPVRIERATGTMFATVATASPGPDGSWSASVAVSRGGDYRAVTDAGVSESRQLVVSDRSIVVRATRSGIAVAVTPSLPYGHLLIEEDLRERFGWWPVIAGRLDYVSEAMFVIARPARVRVVLVAKDGWTLLATSRVVVLGPAPRRAGTAPMHT